MPVTISYDLRSVDTNDRNYIRSALERFHWKRLGGSVFRYEGTGADRDEDWLNHVVPALMFFRSFIAKRELALSSLTIDAHSVALLDFTDPDTPYGRSISSAEEFHFAEPTNPRAGEQALRDFLSAATIAAP